MRYNVIKLYDRSLLNYGLVLIIGITSILFASCSKDDDTPPVVRGCMDHHSLNYNANATEDDGSCTYPRDAFVGVYSVQDTSFNTSVSFSWYTSYTLTIEKGTGTSDIKIINFNNQGLTFTATAASSTVANMASQTAWASASSTIHGTFFLNGNTLTFSTTYDWVDQVLITGKGTR